MRKKKKKREKEKKKEKQTRMRGSYPPVLFHMSLSPNTMLVSLSYHLLAHIDKIDLGFFIPLVLLVHYVPSQCPTVWQEFPWLSGPTSRKGNKLPGFLQSVSLFKIHVILLFVNNHAVLEIYQSSVNNGVCILRYICL